MTRRLRPALVVRTATRDDRDAFEKFSCSTGAWYEDEVEEFIRERALRQALATPDNYRLLVAFEEERMVACGAHHPELLMRGDGVFMITTRLHHLAIATPDQGRVLDDGSRLSDSLLETLMADAIETRTTGILTGIVAQDNLRSIALCERVGLRSQVRYDFRHIRLTGLFERT